MTKIPSVDIFSRVPARLGEGPLWHPQRQSLWWVDITGQKFFEAKLTGEAPRTLDCAQMIGAVVATARGGLLAALHDGIHLVDSVSTTARWIRAAAFGPEPWPSISGLGNRGCIVSRAIALRR